MKREKIMHMVQEELYNAYSHHPLWPADLVHGAAVVEEEAGELVKAALQATYENGSLGAVVTEAIQTIAMGIRFLENFEEMKLYERLLHGGPGQ